MHFSPLAVLAIATLCTACFQPSHERCAVQCGAASSCPPGLTCRTDGYCHADPQEPLCTAIDASLIDGPVNDGAVVDASSDGAAPDARWIDADTTDAGAPMNPGDLIFSEIMKDPVGNEANREWFEIHNTTSAHLEMAGMEITDLASDNIPIVGSLVVPPGGYVVLSKNADVIANDGVTVDYVYGSMELFLSNTDDELVLRTAGGAEIDRVEYDGVDFPDTEGRALSLSADALDRLANDLSSNWCDAQNIYSASLDNRGTPGGANPVCP